MLDARTVVRSQYIYYVVADLSLSFLKFESMFIIQLESSYRMRPRGFLESNAAKSIIECGQEGFECGHVLTVSMSHKLMLSIN